MAKSVSGAFAELQNIINVAKFHKANCHTSDCGVGLYWLGLTAKRLVDHCWLSERGEARRLIHEAEWN